MRRAPATPVRACFVRSCCSVAVQEHDLRATPVQCKHFPHASHCTLHTPRFISSQLFSPYPTSALLISSLLICHLSFHESLPITTTTELACAVRQPRPCVRALCEAVAVLLSRNMTCARPRYNANTFLTLHIALFTPHTPHFTLALHLNSSHLSSSHLIPCLPICQLSSSCLFSCQVLPSTDVYYKSLQKLLPSTTLYYKKLGQSTSQYYFVLQSLHKAHSSTTLYYKVCTNYFPVLLCTTKLAQSTFQYYFVRHSLHKTRSSTTLYYKACKTLPSTTVYYKACTSYFPVLLLQSLHKLLPSTTLYYKACTKSFPVLLCTAKLAQTTSQYILLCTTRLAQSPSQYYFVLQSLHKLLPSTTLYYKACTKSFPVLLCTTKSLRKALPIASKSLNDIGSSAAVQKGLCSRKHCRAMSATPRY